MTQAAMPSLKIDERQSPSPTHSQGPGQPETVPMDQKENLIDKELTLTVVLPGGAEKTTTVPGSLPLRGEQWSGNGFLMSRSTQQVVLFRSTDHHCI
ncbi:hypothetical protein JZ751_020059 [Albula glossodonta]|uniref:Uncharacterized protein n=1 Tax=Albula glossodonta TaxID=121402 RepID=A0A8T2NMI4_9TELE|nr:hypothetical protein JZ751_020059 [Albula glossodonta]